MTIKNEKIEPSSTVRAATQSEYIRLCTRTAHQHGGTCHIAIPNECIGRAYNRYIHPDTGTIVLTPREARNEQ